MDTSRREFIKKSCGICASIVGISMLAASLDSCTPLQYVSAEISNGKISVAKNKFVEGTSLLILKHPSLEYNIALVKSGENSFRAFELKCTHQDNSLVATNSGFHCSLHGSSYSTEGKVSNGPATTNLKEYSTSVVNENVEISL
jgi:Rieske Fe-S protein